jgi:hypothetical protein
MFRNHVIGCKNQLSNFFIYFVIDAHYKSNGQKLYPIFYLFIYFLFPILDQNLVT